MIFHLLEGKAAIKQEQNQACLNSVERKQARSKTKDKESKQCLDFALMMAEYCLSQQIKTFGEALQNQYVDASDECQRYGANHSVFDQLAPSFTMDDLRSLKRGYCGESALRNIITRWKRDGWIEKTDSKHWAKVPQCHFATLPHLEPLDKGRL